MSEKQVATRVLNLHPCGHTTVSFPKQPGSQRVSLVYGRIFGQFLFSSPSSVGFVLGKPVYQDRHPIVRTGP